ncbi:MAG: Smr/MutS family protein [Nitratireductor sp.]|nr:Smr/MutS family protein [Nitratireductor sp.]
MKKTGKSDPRPARRHLTEDEAALWQQVAKTVTPGRGKTAPSSLPDELAPSSSARRKPDMPDSRARKLLPMPSYTPPRSQPAAPAGSGIDDRTARKVLKGQLRIEDRIDLHGMTQSQAHGRLVAFLHRCHGEEKRMVMVITGKGRMSGGILRQMVPHWLREPQCAVYVSAFREAHVSHGGQGALYVRLRRGQGTERPGS